MIRTVLLPVDLSPEGALVVRFAAGLRALGVARIVCAHVLDDCGLEGPVIAARVDAMREELRRRAEPLLAAGIDVECRIPTGDAESELLSLAMEAHVDAIVCGTSGKSATGRLLVGSVSEQLATRSPVPSLLVRNEVLRNAADPAALAAGFARRLLVPTDFSPTATRALGVAVSFPPAAVSALRILHVVQDAGDGRAADAEHGAEFQLRNLVEAAHEQGLAASAVIGHGDPVRAALAEIDESDISGVVTGSRGRGVLRDALLGSVSMTLVRQASVPVMIVP